MKRLLLLLAVMLLPVCGCSRFYIMRLSNGSQITTKGKPRLKDNTYYYKDAQGQTRSVAQGRVKEIMPASMAQEETKTRFNPSGH